MALPETLTMTTQRRPDSSLDSGLIARLANWRVEALPSRAMVHEIRDHFDGVNHIALKSTVILRRHFS